MRRLRLMAVAVAAISALFVALAIPAMAGKKSNAVTGSIDLMAPAARTAEAGPAMTYGDYADFATEVNGRVASQARVYVSVVCVQDGNVVYQWSAAPDFSFPLVDQAGQGLEWDGGAADCMAALVYRVEKGKNVSISYLDTEEFAVGAAG